MEVFSRFRRIAALLGGLVSNRLTLFSIEAREEFERQFLHLALLLACCAFAGMGLLFAAAALLILGWQNGHLLGTAMALAGGFVLLALGLALLLRQRMRAAPLPFPATIEEFAKDAAALHKPPGADE